MNVAPKTAGAVNDLRITRAATAPKAAAAAGRVSATTAPANNPHARLRRACNELQALFLQQLFQAMRDSVPEGDPSTDASGEEIFTSMLDENMASLSAERENRGLGEALYHQLARRLPAEDPS